MRITVRDASSADLELVHDSVRMADRGEWTAGTGRLFLMSAIDAIDYAEIAKVAIGPDGVPLCFWGGTRGSVWLFATEAAERRALSLHKVLAENLSDLTKRWEMLTAVADVRNTKHLRWLSWLGFEQVADLELPPYNMTFRVFAL